MIIDIDSKNFKKETEKGLKLIVFSAKWCSYCQRENEVFKEIPEIWLGKIDGDKSPELVAQFGIMGFPTFILFKDGKILTKFSGYKNKFELMNTLNKFI